VVHGGPHPVLAPDFVDGVDFVAVKQDPLGKGSFPRIDMRADPDIPHPGNVDAHFVFILLYKAAVSPLTFNRTVTRKVTDYSLAYSKEKYDNKSLYL
jgi:hypothetical protein